MHTATRKKKEGKTLQTNKKKKDYMTEEIRKHWHIAFDVNFLLTVFFFFHAPRKP
jgi:hypothetical protein